MTEQLVVQRMNGLLIGFMYSLIAIGSPLVGINHHKNAKAAQAMVRNALVYACHHPKWGVRKPSVAFIVEGPYGIPCLQGNRS